MLPLFLRKAYGYADFVLIQLLGFRTCSQLFFLHFLLSLFKSQEFVLQEVVCLLDPTSLLLLVAGELEAGGSVVHAFGRFCLAA